MTNEIVSKIAQLYSEKTNNDKWDLYEVGLIGWRKAANSYAENMNISFEEYAKEKVEGEIRRFCR